MICKCGCGKEAGTKNGRKLKYFSTECYPSHKKTAASKNRPPEEKLCHCGCGQWFEDATPQRQKKFYNRHHQLDHWAKTKGADSENSHAGKHYKDHRAKICNNDGKGPLCVQYSECTAPRETGGKRMWKIIMEYQTNGGKNCYKAPRDIQRVNLGGSLSTCTVND
jgi:hypothetical protein